MVAWGLTSNRWSIACNVVKLKVAMFDPSQASEWWLPLRIVNGRLELESQPLRVLFSFSMLSWDTLPAASGPQPGYVEVNKSRPIHSLHGGSCWLVHVGWGSRPACTNNPHGFWYAHCPTVICVVSSLRCNSSLPALPAAAGPGCLLKRTDTFDSW